MLLHIKFNTYREEKSSFQKIVVWGGGYNFYVKYVPYLLYCLFFTFLYWVLIFSFFYHLQEAEQRRISEAKQRQHSVDRIENINNNINSTSIVSSTSNNNIPAMRGFQVQIAA